MGCSRPNKKLEPRFVEAARLDKVGIGAGAVVTIAGFPVALFNAGGLVYALSAWCAYCGASLGRGTFRGKIVTCRGCGWRYEVNTGSVVGIPALRLDTFRVKVVDGRILVAIR